MKKTNKKKRNILAPIGRFFDKLIITPITKLILYITDYFENNTSGIEKILTNRQSLVIISLLFALVVFFFVDTRSTSLIDNKAEILYGQPVEAIYNEEAYVVEGLPKTVDVTLIGKTWDVYLAKQYPAENATVDLQDLKPGTHKVSLKYKQSVSSVQYKLDPSNVTIVIYEKMSEARELTADVINRDKLDSKLNVDSVELNCDKVIIKGAEHKLAEVATVKALVDISKIAGPKEGDVTLKDIKLVAYDDEGKQVNGIEIVSEEVKATVKISSPSKVVPIKVNTEGVLYDKAIKSLTPSVDRVTIYGPEEVLNSIDSLPVTIDVAGLDGDKEYTVNLVTPTGVRSISEKTITVKVTVDEMFTREITDVNINIKNLDSRYRAQAVDADSRVIAVVIHGSKSVINSIDKDSITATIDLEGLGVGEHEVDVQVTGSDSRVKYEPRNKKVKIMIYNK